MNINRFGVALALKEHLAAGSGYVFYYRKSNNKIYVWEYEIKKKRGDKTLSQTHITKIYENTPDKTTLLSIIENHSKFIYIEDNENFENNC